MTRYLIANWKMNLPAEGIEQFGAAAGQLEGGGEVRIVIAPPYPFIDAVRRAVDGSDVGIGAQNCSNHPYGAYTGEVSASMLAEAGARWVIIGHSERRALFGEDDWTVGRKLIAAFEAGLVPVFCIGEDESTRDSGGTEQHLAQQIERGLRDVAASVPNLIVAYEPVWAIGTGKVASPEIVAETHAMIASRLGELSSREIPPILYGGSVSPENAAALAAVDLVGGFLVGGASLDSGKFSAIHGALAGVPGRR